MSTPLDPPLLHTAANEHVRAAVRTAPVDRLTHQVILAVEIDDGWRLFGIGAEFGMPISLRSEPPERLRDVAYPAGELTGTIEVHALLDRADSTTRLWLRYQLCGGSICRPPAELELPLTDNVRR